MPAFARFMAIPPPIVPEPTIPAALIGIKGVSLGISAILEAARSPKNI